MIDEAAKAGVHQELRWVRRSLVSKLDGLSEYDVRRPVTKTGTNLLGLVKHLTLSEARYLGEVFGRPFPLRLPRFEDPGYVNHDYMWATEQESRADIVQTYQRACEHADATIEELPIDAAGLVVWWLRPNVTLFNVMVHVLTETNRHAGHADILRELIDGAVGETPEDTSPRDEPDWASHRAQVERAARNANPAT